MNEEIKTIKKNKGWELINYPGKKAIDFRWICKQKLNSNGEIVNHKARLVAKGFLQKFGINFNEVYAPVARLKTIKLVVVVSAYIDWKMCQLYLKHPSSMDP